MVRSTVADGGITRGAAAQRPIEPRSQLKESSLELESNSRRCPVMSGISSVIWPERTELTGGPTTSMWPLSTECQIEGKSAPFRLAVTHRLKSWVEVSFMSDRSER